MGFVIKCPGHLGLPFSYLFVLNLNSHNNRTKTCQAKRRIVLGNRLKWYNEKKTIRRGKDALSKMGLPSQVLLIVLKQKKGTIHSQKT